LEDEYIKKGLYENKNKIVEWKRKTSEQIKNFKENVINVSDSDSDPSLAKDWDL